MTKRKAGHVHRWAIDGEGLGVCKGCMAVKQFQHRYLGPTEGMYRWGNLSINGNQPFPIRRSEYEEEDDE